METINIVTEHGLLFKSENKFIADSNLVEIHKESKNLLQTGNEYRKIKTQDVVLLHASDSGWNSIKAIIWGILFVILGVQLLDTVAAVYVIITGLLLVFYGVQREFRLEVEYLARSRNVPLVNDGKLTFEGNGNLPFVAENVAKSITGVSSSNVVDSWKVRSSSISFLGTMRELKLYDDFLEVNQDKGGLFSKTYTLVPLKNIISVVAHPLARKSWKFALLGVSLLMGGLFTFSIDAGTSITLVVVGSLLVIYGLQKLAKVEITVREVNGDSLKVVFEGVLMSDSTRFLTIAETIMNQVMNSYGGAEQ